MAEVLLNKGFVTLVDDADVERMRGITWHASGSAEKGIYVRASVRVDGKRQQLNLHRWLLGLEDRSLVVDHINGDTLDNRRENLRICTHRENLRNQRRRYAPGYKGIRYRPRTRRWEVSVSVDGKQHALGSYRSEIQAAVAYDIGAKHHFGEFAALNFSPERDWLFPYVFDEVLAKRKPGRPRKGAR